MRNLKEDDMVGLYFIQLIFSGYRIVYSMKMRIICICNIFLILEISPSGHTSGGIGNNDRTRTSEC